MIYASMRYISHGTNTHTKTKGKTNSSVFERWGINIPKVWRLWFRMIRADLVRINQILRLMDSKTATNPAVIQRREEASN